MKTLVDFIVVSITNSRFSLTRGTSVVRINWFGVALLSMGCSREPREVTPPATEYAESETVASSAQLPKIPTLPPVIAQPPDELSDDQVLRLLSTNWKLDERATLEHSGNAEIDLAEFEAWALENGVEWSMTCTFQNDGLNCTTSQKRLMIDLPIRDKAFSQRIRVIDNDSFAIQYDTYWLIFNAF